MGKRCPSGFAPTPASPFISSTATRTKVQLVVDFVGYDNLDIFEELYVDKLDEEGISRVDPCFRRYVLPLNLSAAKVGENLVDPDYSRAQAKLQPDGSVFLKPDFILDGNNKVVMELPRINYDKFNGRKYRYVYGTGIFGSNMQLTKLDLDKREVVTWKEDGWMPGEPVFVPEPGAAEEDKGVVLCPVLSKTGKDPCFLLILDGQTFQEIARAETPADLKMPLTFHGNYVPKAK
ncbi:beta,beta-carotene 15,15'-dioxygenase-like [Pomacea canaliculata]|uniref:beta,beta-carotene 15,15'-dioxygenase-like n=1 Tax=Pomacea canaliculata TaxID=400727 RepID=UPI000D732709|nr:beta,beta-carotene 15,15'-dioxygenase-like [Pomacea canaliculata]